MIIDNFLIDNDSNAFIIAEISANHGGNINIIKDTILEAKNCGANAIKIQTYTADTLTLNCKNSYFKINSDTPWDGKFLYDLYKNSYTPWSWHKEIFDFSKSIGITIFSSPFDKSSVDFLESLDTPAYKIASFEITDIPLIEYVASKSKPILISTGIAVFEDILLALNTCYKKNNKDIALLKCVSSYPSKIESSNLNTLKDMKDSFNTIVGLSDHSLDIEVPLASICFGAKIIEKHFILNKSIKSPDSSFSLTPTEFKNMVDSIRKIEKSFGVIDYSLSLEKEKNRKFAKSIFVSKYIKKGEILTTDNIKVVRPNFGIHPKYFYNILGRKAKYDLEFGTPLDFSLIE